MPARMSVQSGPNSFSACMPLSKQQSGNRLINDSLEMVFQYYIHVKITFQILMVAPCHKSRTRAFHIETIKASLASHALRYYNTCQEVTENKLQRFSFLSELPDKRVKALDYTTAYYSSGYSDVV